MDNFSAKINGKIWLTLAAVVAILFVFIFLIITPLYKGIASLRAELDSSEKAIMEAETRVKNYQAAVEEFRRIESGREKITAMFPPREEMVVLVQGLESAVALAGASSALQIVDELENPKQKVAGASEAEGRPGVVEGLAAITEIPFKITLKGDYRALVDFFLGFEHMTFVSAVSKIAVTADTEQNELTETLINTGSGTAVVEGTFFIRDRK